MSALVHEPNLANGISVLVAASISLSDPAVSPLISTGGESSRGWMALANFSICATNSG